MDGDSLIDRVHPYRINLESHLKRSAVVNKDAMNLQAIPLSA